MSLLLMISFITCFMHAADDITDISSTLYPIASVIEPGMIAAMLAARKSDRLYIACDGYVTIWDMAHEPKREKKMRHGKKVNFMQLNDDETRFFSGSSDGVVNIWDVKDWKYLGKLDVDRKLQDLLYVHDRLYVGGDNAIKIFSVKNDACELIESHMAMDILDNFKFHNDRLYYTDGQRVIHERNSHNMKKSVICYEPGGTFEMNEQYIFFAKRFFGGHDIWVLRMREKKSFKKHAKLKGHTKNILDLECIPGKDILCSSSFDKTIKLWDTKTCALLATLLCKDIPCHLTTSQNAIYARYPDGNIEKWDLTRFYQLQELAKRSEKLKEKEAQKSRHKRALSFS